MKQNIVNRLVTTIALTYLTTPLTVLAGEETETCPTPQPHVMTHRFESGPVAGQCISIEHYRVPVVISQQEAQKYDFPEYGPRRLTVANVTGIDAFYAASIPLDAVENVILQVRPFSTPVDVNPLPQFKIRNAHSQVRVLFSEPVWLTPQTPGGELIEVYELILSNQGVGVKEDINQLTDGFNGSLLHIGVVFTAANKIEKQIVELDSDVYQYQTTFDSAEQSAFLETYIREHYVLGTSRPYNTATLNSNIGLLKIFDAVRPPKFWPLYVGVNNADNVMRAYTRRGLLDLSIDLPKWADDPTAIDQIEEVRAAQ